MARQKTGGRTKAALFLLGSIGVAVLTTIAVVKVLSSYSAALEKANKPPETVDVVLATRDLYMGIPITTEDIAVTKLLPEMVPQDLVFATAEEVIGRTPRERILANETIRVERLARRDAGVGLNAIITPGKRAMAVEVDVQSGVAFFLQPSNYVDVIVTIKPDEKQQQAKWMTETILQGIRVLAVDSSMSLRPSESEANDKKAQGQSRKVKPSVTLELNLEEAEKLALAVSRGDIHLVLRSDVDITQHEVGPALTTSDLIGFSPTKPAAAAVRTVATKKVSGPVQASSAEVIQGDTTKVEGFDQSGNKIETKKKNR
jgi:pilus assembly protein CpaB